MAILSFILITIYCYLLLIITIIIAKLPIYYNVPFTKNNENDATD